MRQECRTTCSRDCPDACGIVVTVEDGRIVSHRGDPAHAITRGHLCARGNHYLERFNNPDRLLEPRRRTASGAWQRINWDDALDLVAEKLAHYRATLGPQAVLAITYSAMRGWVARVLWRRFWANYGGATLTRGGLSVEAVDAAQLLDLGEAGAHAPEDLANSRGFVVWGRNLVVTRLHVMHFISQARKTGAPLFVIDPLCTATTKIADRHFQLRPGSDGVLALGVARRIIERNAFASDFVEKHCNGFEAYRALAFSRTIEEVARVTDLSVAQIDELAGLYSTTRPVATFAGLGPGYWRQGGASVRLIDALAALTGNLGVSGGGAHADRSSGAGLDLSSMKSAARPEMRTVRLACLGDDVLAAAAPPIRMGFIQGANPAAAAPDTGKVRSALRGLEFLVVVEQFMSATTEHAHLVLPCTTYLETDDLITAYGHTWLGLTRRAVAPRGEAKSDAEILQSLASRLGFGAALAGDPDSWIEKLLAPMATHGVTLAKLREGACPNPLVPAVPFADHRFSTPSGKYEFLTSFAPEPAGDGNCLHLVATKTLHMLNAQVQTDADLPAEPVVRVHPRTLATRNLDDKAMAWLESPVGRVRVRVCSDESVRADVVLFNPARWRGESSGVNQLREAYMTDCGDGAAMHATRVTLAP